MVREVSRRHGWDWPPHPMQVSSWLVKVFVFTVSLGILGSAPEALEWRCGAWAAIGSLLLLVVICMCLVTSIDPADESIAESVNARRQRLTLDRSKHPRVITSDHFCNICEGFVDPTSKHCRQCNKCVINFDHHCKWLNNCVGSKNYKQFIVYVISISVGSLLLIIACAFLWCQFIIDRDRIRSPIVGDRNGSLYIFEQPVVEPVWFILLGLNSVLLVATFVLTTHLLIFHLKLIKRGMTTYSYIMESRVTPATVSDASVKVKSTNQDVGHDNSVITISGSMGHQNGILDQSDYELQSRRGSRAKSIVSAKSISDSTMATKILDPDELEEGMLPNQPTSTVVTLPPIHNGNNTGDHTQHNSRPINGVNAHHRDSLATKVFEPQFESVISSTGEMFLPSIMVKAPSIHSDDQSVARLT